MHLLIGLIAFLFISFLVGFAVHKNEADKDKRLRKGMITTVIIALLGLGSLGYYVFQEIEHEDRRRLCHGYPGDIELSDLYGKWEDGISFYEFASDQTYRREFFDSGEIKGRWEIQSSILFLIIEGADSRSAKDAYRICDISRDEMVIMYLNDGGKWTLRRVKN